MKQCVCDVHTDDNDDDEEKDDDGGGYYFFLYSVLAYMS